jgi:topoisomerase IV subunit A
MVMSLRDALREWLDHRKEVLLRRTRFRLGEIAKRLEILDGYLIAYLNIDEVIRIIRREDEPKPVLIKRFKLTDIQAEAILNMRLRALRRLEEFEIRTEHTDLKKEQSALNKLLKSDDAQWDRIADEIKSIKAKYAKTTPLGKRRTSFSAPPEVDFDAEQAFVEKEPITVVCSERGWIRTMKGHLESPGDLAFKEGDRLKFLAHAQTTDRIMLFFSSGKFFTFEAAKLPGGRGHGEPLRLMADLDVSDRIVALFVHYPERKLLIASSTGDGFIVPEAECVATTRKGKQVLNVKPPAEARLCIPVEEAATHLAVIGENRKLLIFPLAEVPEMSRGKGVRLQKYKDGGLSDARTFRLKDGLAWIDSSRRTFSVTDLKDWIGERAQAGRLPPKGFPRNNRFA